MDLDDLGQRICILGPSNSGKSTLAAAIGRARSLPVIHLDQYRHLPGTQWVERPDPDFERMHNEAMDTDQWVIDGNYSRWLPGRLRRSTGLVLLDASTAASIVRYFRRSLFEPDRAGSLDGTRDRVRIEMVRFLLTRQEEPSPVSARLRRVRSAESVSAGPCGLGGVLPLEQPGSAKSMTADPSDGRPGTETETGGV